MGKKAIPAKKMTEANATRIMDSIAARPKPEPFLIHIINNRNVVVGQTTANQASLDEVIMDLRDQYTIDYRIDVYALLSMSVE